MTREEANELQDRLDEYSKLSDTRDEDLRTETESVSRRRELAISTMKHILAGKIEPYIPTIRVPGIGFDLSAMIGAILSVASPKAFDASTRIAVVDGYKEEDDEGRRDEYMKKYGVTVPGDVMKAAMNIRTTREAYELMSGYVPSGKKKEEEA